MIVALPGDKIKGGEIKKPEKQGFGSGEKSGIIQRLRKKFCGFVRYCLPNPYYIGETERM